MQSRPVERKIRYEGNTAPGFTKGISTTPGCGDYRANCPALTLPSRRVIRKSELVINDKAYR